MLFYIRIKLVRSYVGCQSFQARPDKMLYFQGSYSFQRKRSSFLNFLKSIENTGQLYVHLDAPEEMGEFEWPTNGLGSLLPTTKSNIGDISWDNSETFIVHVGNTTLIQMYP